MSKKTFPVELGPATLAFLKAELRALRPIEYDNDGFGPITSVDKRSESEKRAGKTVLNRRAQSKSQKVQRRAT